MTEPSIKELASMFKKLDKSDIENAVSECGGDANEAITQLVKVQCGRVKEKREKMGLEGKAAEEDRSSGSACGLGGADDYRVITRSLLPSVPDYEKEPPHEGTIEAPVEHNGFKRALIIGVNYTGTQFALNGCIPDTKRIKTLLTDVYEFSDSSRTMVILTDDQTDKPMFMPTRKNICNAIKWLTNDCRAGDALFFSYSGHGAQVPTKGNYELDGLDETILPVDWQSEGMIIDYELHKMLVGSLPPNVRMTIFMDCCHSGSVVDLPFVYDVKGDKFKLYKNPYFTEADTVLFSGCRDAQTSADVKNASFGTGGAMTMAFIQTVMDDPYDLPYKALMSGLHSNMKRNGFKQLPQMSSNQQFDPKNSFSLTRLHGQTNELLGKATDDHESPIAGGKMDQLIASAQDGAVAGGGGDTGGSGPNSVLAQIPFCGQCLNQSKGSEGLDMSMLFGGGFQNFDNVVNFITQQISG